MCRDKDPKNARHGVSCGDFVNILCFYFLNIEFFIKIRENPGGVAAEIEKSHKTQNKKRNRNKNQSRKVSKAPSYP